MRRAVIGLAGLVPLACAAQAPAPAAPKAAPSPALAHPIDALFAPWSRPESAGCALGVIQDGQLVYQRGYGMADLEHQVPITPATVFHVASMSKQFTAFAIYLLAADGKLSLDDDIHKYLPELHDFGTPITIRHLLHHTSGLRDQWSLLGMAGWRLEDVITEDDILHLIWRQKNLNFMPGEEFLYSNTGFTLLGVIVERVSGKPLAAFTKERIFDPLGMRNTHVHDDYGVLVPRRAYSYFRQEDGQYRYTALSYSNSGATSLFTTVRDLALWDQNFYDGRVGGKALLAQMQQTVALNDGQEIDYASGLEVGHYRGLPIVEHSGADAGFRSEMIRFPAQHFSVTTLCNAADAPAARLARQVAGVFLGHEMTPLGPPAPTPAARPKPVAIDPASLAALVGEYQLNRGYSVVYTQENGQLMAQATGEGKQTLFPSGERTFTFNTVNASVTFDPPGPDGVVARLVHHQDGRDLEMTRIRRGPMSPEELRAHAGEYYSDELHVLYTVREQDGGLVLVHPRGELALHREADPDGFSNDMIGGLRFSCAPAKDCDGFSLTDGRARGLRFIRAQLAYTPFALAPAVLDRYAGHYQLRASMVVTISREADHLLAQLTGRPRYELFPSSDHEFFAKAEDLHVSFRAGSAGIDLSLNGRDLSGPRVDAASAQAAQDFVRRRQADNVPQSGSEAALRAVLDGLRGGVPPYERLDPPLAQHLRQELPELQAHLSSLGPIQRLEHLGVGESGEDVYAVRFAHAAEEWRLTLTTDGHIEGLLHRPLKQASRLPPGDVAALRSGTSGEPGAIDLLNRTGAALQIYSIDSAGTWHRYGDVASQHLKTLSTYGSQLWLLAKDQQAPLAVFAAAPGLTLGQVE